MLGMLKAYSPICYFSLYRLSCPEVVGAQFKDVSNT